MSETRSFERSDTRQPAFPAGVRLVNHRQRGWILLAPERVFQADAIAAEILQCCDGVRTIDQMVDDLAKRHSAPREHVMTDVVALLERLAEQKLLKLGDA